MTWNANTLENQNGVISMMEAMIRMKDRFDPEHKIRKSFGTDLCLKNNL